MELPPASREEEDEDLEQAEEGERGGSRQELQYGQYSADADTRVLYYTMLTAEQEDESGEPLDTSDPRDSTASPEELEDEDNSGDNDNIVTKSCTYQGCQETTSQVAKQRKPWMCKKHRNKMYKDKYKNKKKSDQAMSCASKLEVSSQSQRGDSPECSVSIAKQRTGSVGDRPPRPTLLEQVLNQKRLVSILCLDVVDFITSYFIRR
ncbi:regulatory factor X-associated protein isoform X3 [Eleutherodactylus coqui]|uniref:regulatory factor X-associated protein isoform X3 n=1 Tax=Eleutherodactylus coqui TaxID=57060 RepID=UPI0034637577